MGARNLTSATILAPRGLTQVIMDAKSWMAIGLAVALLLLAGIWHLVGIRAINRFGDYLGHRRYWSVLAAFWGIALLHLSEIAIAAGVLGIAIHWLELGTFGAGYGGSPVDFFYISGLTYTSMGYSHEEVNGPARILTMINGLAGLMLITWSATYVYSIWGKYFTDPDEESAD